MGLGRTGSLERQVEEMGQLIPIHSEEVCQLQKGWGNLSAPYSLELTG